MARKRSPRPRYLIHLAGVASSTVWAVDIDDRFRLTPIHPSALLALVPLEGGQQPTLEEAVFYANALSFDHDTPTLLLPEPERALVRPVVPPKPFTARWYYEDQGGALEAVMSMRLGGGVVLVFRWDEDAPELKLTSRLGPVKKEISLYAMATRQLDPMGEFLCLYRVLESVSGSNGVAWVGAHLSKLAGFRFGRLDVADSVLRGPQGDAKYTNVFAVLKRRAISRLHALARDVGNDDAVARYLYAIRNDLAHGKTTVRVYDHGATVQSVGRELPLMRLLSRLAIEQKRTRP